MALKLVRKDDHSIAVTGTKELIWGEALIVEASMFDGKIEVEYRGTNVNWDSQTTVTDPETGGRIFIDENSNEVTEDNVELIEASDQLQDDEDESDEELLHHNFISELGDDPIDAEPWSRGPLPGFNKRD